MTAWIVEGALALLVLIGTAIIVWGVRRFNLSPGFLAVTFAITAASWLAFIITTISLTVRTLVLSSI